VYSKVRSDKVAFQLDLAEYDCVGFETATLEEKSFGSDGTLTKDMKSTKIEWQPVAEDTLGEALLTFACMYKVNKASGRASGLMEIDRRQFVRQNLEINIGKGAMIAVSKPADPIVAVPKLQREIAVLPGTLSVQLLAADRMAVAQASLDNLQKAHVSWLRSLHVGVDPVSLKGKTIYRAVIRGFNSTGEAIALCRTLQTAGYDCLVRRPAKSSQG